MDLNFFFYQSFILLTFMIHRTAVEVGGHLFNSLYHLYPFHKHLDITAECSPPDNPSR